MISLDLHVHSCFSFDSLTTPAQILYEAKRKGLSGVAVTDHETIQGGLATLRLNQAPDFLVIVGAEYYTEAGDIIGLFLREEIVTRDPLVLIDDIHRQGGIALLPHPYHGHASPVTIAEKADVIEVFNARETAANNDQALALANKLNKPVLCASDAHFRCDIGTCRTIFSTKDVCTELLRNQCRWTMGYTPRYRMSASQIVKAIKLRRYHHVPYHAARLAKRLVIRG
jgi:predicted metal-dependent phosphoesterase TrpH